jgi:hypothetical protein
MTTKTLTGKAGVKGTPLYSTVEDVTLYVRAGGSDTANGLTVGTALLTIQEAVDRVPAHIEHDIVIDIGEGNFAGFAISGKNVVGTLTVQGVLGNPTLNTGEISGTSDGGTTKQLVDTADGAWTVNELRGMLLEINGEYRVIYDNDATTINVCGVFGATASGKAYEIFEQKTVIQGTETVTGYATFTLIATTARSTGGSGIDAINISDLYFDGQSTATIGAFVYYATGCKITRCKATDAVYGIGVFQCSGGCKLDDVYSADNTTGFYVARTVGSSDLARIFAYNNTDGIVIMNCPSVDTDYVYSSGNSENGLAVVGYSSVDIDGGIIEDNVGYGILVGGGLQTPSGESMKAGSCLDASGAVVIQNNGNGVYANQQASIRLTAVSGTNTEWGIVADSGSIVLVTSATAITGASGDATIDEGATPLVWATDFADDGDTVSNDNNYCLIERKD